MSIRFGDIVLLRIYDNSKVNKGYITFDGTTALHLSPQHSRPSLFAVTPFAFFAEDEERLSEPISNSFFTLQQVPWYAGCDLRFKLINDYDRVNVKQTDISNQDERSARSALFEADGGVARYPQYNRLYHLSLGEGNEFFNDNFEVVKLKDACKVQFIRVKSLDEKRNHQTQAYFPFKGTFTTLKGNAGGCCKN